MKQTYYNHNNLFQKEKSQVQLNSEPHGKFVLNVKVFGP